MPLSPRLTEALDLRTHIFRALTCTKKLHNGYYCLFLQECTAIPNYARWNTDYDRALLQCDSGYKVDAIDKKSRAVLDDNEMTASYRFFHLRLNVRHVMAHLTNCVQLMKKCHLLNIST